MILEYAAAGGTVVIVLSSALLLLVLLLARSNDTGAYELAELAAIRSGSDGPPWPDPGSQTRCPNPACRGRRCASWRHRGIACSPPDEPALAEPAALADPAALSDPAALAGPDGRHGTHLAVVRWLAGDWWASPMPIRLRRQLGRMAGAARVPAQLGFPLGKLP